MPETHGKAALAGAIGDEQAPPPKLLLRRLRRRFLDSKEQFTMRGDVIRLALRTVRSVFMLSLLVNLLSAVLLMAFILFSSRLLEAIPEAVGKGWNSAPGRMVELNLIVAGACFIGVQALGPVKEALGVLITRRVDGAVRDRLASESVETEGLAPFENQALLTHLAVAKDGLEEGSQTPGAAVAGLLTLSGLYFQSILAAALISVLVSPVVGLVLLASGLLVRGSHRIGLAREAKVNAGKRAELMKESAYYRELGLSRDAGKEFRVFGLADWLGERFREVAVRALEATAAERRAIHGARFIPPVLITLAGAAGSLLWIAHQAVNGSISIEQLVVTLQAGYTTLSIGNYFVEDWQTQYGLMAHSALESFGTGIATASAKLPSPWRGTQDPRGIPRQSIQFRGVSFRYPGGDELVLDGLDLDIPAGRSLAIVGLNGTGKTTLIKLLCGLYEPSAGAILVDGVNLQSLARGAWQRNVATIFQDFVHYQFSAAENIAFAGAALPENQAAIHRAAEQAGILRTLESLPAGLAAPLSSSYRGGTDLSGGQWQRLALARALYAMASGAGILVLDEPTASLDIRSETAFLDRFVELTEGLTTIMISHRFAAVRRADWIVTLEAGRVAEQGTHESLLSANGQYRRLFDLQAERFTSMTDNAQRTGSAE